MYRNLLALAALIAMQAVALQARAVTTCAAGNPDTTSVAELTPTSAFVNHNDGTVTHTLTGLMWKQCVEGSSGAGCAGGAPAIMIWSVALAAAVADTTAGHGDWRLPNKKELESIVESCGFQPAINQTLFPATPVSRSFWSSSSRGPTPALAWAVGFDAGFTDGFHKSAELYVRLVRGGQSFASFDANHAWQSALDVDGNGTADALTDGLLVVRYLFGLRGPAMINGAIGTGASRTTSPDIEAYLKNLMP